MDFAQAAIDDLVARPAAARYAHFLDRDPEDLDLEVGMGKNSDHANQIIEDVEQADRASGSAALDRTGPVGRDLRITRRFSTTGLTIRMRCAGQQSPQLATQRTQGR